MVAGSSPAQGASFSEQHQQVARHPQGAGVAHSVARSVDRSRFGAAPRATITLDQTDIDALRGVKTEPTKRAPGHWRCVYWVRPWSMRIPDACVHLADGEWAFPLQFPSEDVADASGRSADRINAANGYADDIRYIRAEYFPEYA